MKRDNTTLPLSSEIELLGVTVDNKLKFENHTRSICRKVSRQVTVLQRMKKILSFETKKDIYFSFILSNFNYFSEVWNQCSKRYRDKLEKVNERALRFVFSDYHSPYATLLQRFELSSLENQRNCTTVRKVLNTSNVPTAISELVKKRSSTYNLRGDNTVQLPKVNSTKHGLRSWRYTVVKLRNNLPNETRLIKEYKMFVEEIKKLDVDN